MSLNKFAARAARLVCFASICLGAAEVRAQALMLPTCGSPPPSWIVGGAYPLTMNAAGTLCVTSATSGSVSLDLSAGKPALPNVGASFGPSGPYASYVLVATVPAGPRNLVAVENTSGGQIAVVLDDGSAATGATPANASVFALTGGPTAGAQGGSWISGAEKGRVQIYAPSATAQVMVRVN